MSYHPSSHQKWSINCYDPKLTQLLQRRCLRVLISIDRFSKLRICKLSIDMSFLELPKMQCACVTLAEKLRRRLSLFCTFPCGHWIRANIQCGHRKVVCLFKQETPEGVRWPLWKRGRNPATRHRNIASQLHI